MVDELSLMMIVRVKRMTLMAKTIGVIRVIRIQDDEDDPGDLDGGLEEEVVPVDESQTVAKGRPNCCLDKYNFNLYL